MFAAAIVNRFLFNTRPNRMYVQEVCTRINRIQLPLARCVHKVHTVITVNLDTIKLYIDPSRIFHTKSEAAISSRYNIIHAVELSKYCFRNVR